MLLAHLIDKHHHFSRPWGPFSLVQVILGDINSHSCFSTPCRKAYDDILPVQGWLGNFHLVRPQLQFWLGGPSCCCVFLIWRKLKRRHIREGTSKNVCPYLGQYFLIQGWLNDKRFWPAKSLTMAWRLSSLPKVCMRPHTKVVNKSM